MPMLRMEIVAGEILKGRLKGHNIVSKIFGGHHQRTRMFQSCILFIAFKFGPRHRGVEHVANTHGTTFESSEKDPCPEAR